MCLMGKWQGDGQYKALNEQTRKFWKIPIYGLLRSLPRAIGTEKAFQVLL